jgi:hypothetical protein
MMATEERAVMMAGSPRPIFNAYINGGVRVRSKWVDQECVDGGWFRGSSDNLTILPVLEMNAKLTKSASDEPGNLPRDFWQAMVSPEWREWISAVKAEIESWDLFEAVEEVSFDDMEWGATIIPLGELFTIKRTGKHKFRQIAMGNLMKEGRDYGETFSSTVSGDGIRRFFALAAVCGFEVRGWDATTGYLQVEQLVPVYAYLPSHHGFSNLSFEALGELRMTLLQKVKEEGIENLRKMARNEVSTFILSIFNWVLHRWASSPLSPLPHRQSLPPVDIDG